MRIALNTENSQDIPSQHYVTIYIDHMFRGVLIMEHNDLENFIRILKDGANPDDGIEIL